jgi:hypothetical protein
VEIHNDPVDEHELVSTPVVLRLSMGAQDVRING